MGMFDRVYVKCPKCDTEAEFQSKAGDCTLTSYHEGDMVPLEIVEDLRGCSETCAECGTEVQPVPIVPPPRGVIMIGVRYRAEEY